MAVPDDRTDLSDLWQRLDDMADRQQELTAEVCALRDQVRDMMDADVKNRKYRPISELYAPGDQTTVVVEDDGTNTKHGDPCARVDGIVVFLQPPDGDYDVGDRLKATVTQVDDSHMRAAVYDRADGGEDGD